MKKRMLIVDDTKTWQKFNEGLVNEFFSDVFDITSAFSATEAFKIILNNLHNPFDIILSDLQMEQDYEPKIAGEWLIEKIKSYKEYEKTPILVISGIYNLDLTASSMDVNYIQKSRLADNKLLMKYNIEKLLPDIKNIKIKK